MLILTVMSSSVPLFTLTVLPRYANDEISSRFQSLILIGLLDVQPWFWFHRHSTSASDFVKIFYHPCDFVLHLLVVVTEGTSCRLRSRNRKVVSVGSIGCRFVSYLLSPSLSNWSQAGTRMVTSSCLVLGLSLLQNYLTISQHEQLYR